MKFVATVYAHSNFQVCFYSIQAHIILPNRSIIPQNNRIHYRKIAGTDAIPCPTCSTTFFCNAACAAAASHDAGSHWPLVCHALSACNLSGLSEEHQSVVHFLIRAASLLWTAAAMAAAVALHGNSTHAFPSSLSHVFGADASGRDAIQRVQALNSLARRPDRPQDGEGDLATIEIHGRVARALDVALRRVVGHKLGTTMAAFENIKEVFSPAVCDKLLDIDVVNGYGIAAPFDPGSEDSRRLRGSGLYEMAARINHECLPNVVRCDDFDPPPQTMTMPPGSNTVIQFRMMHALPAGEEVTQSYFPLTWTYAERQTRCREQYGFTCRCPRCREESTWPAEARGGDTTAEHESLNEMEVDTDGHGMQGVQEGAEADAAYIHVFVLKFVCPRDACGGSMAPLPGVPDRLQCNLCRLERTEADFLAELEQGG